MTPIIPIYGYGYNPAETGTLMAMCPDDGFAADICGALCAKHPGQWFGYVDRHGEVIKRKMVVISQ